VGALFVFNPVLYSWAFVNVPPSGSRVTGIAIVASGVLVAALMCLAMRRDFKNQRFIVTNERIIKRSGVLLRTTVLERSEMTDVRSYYDGGMMQAFGKPTLEFELDGCTTTFKLPDTVDADEALAAIFGGTPEPAGMLGGATRRRQRATL